MFDETVETAIVPGVQVEKRDLTEAEVSQVVGGNRALSDAFY